MQTMKFDKKEYCLFGIVVLSLLLQNVMFSNDVWHSIPISSIWKNPAYGILGWWLPKVSSAIFLSSFCFLFRRKIWMVVVSLFVNLWIISNLLYFAARNLFIDFNSILLIGELKGFGSSLSTLWEWSMLKYVGISIGLLIIILVFFSKTSRINWRHWLVWMVVGIITSSSAQYQYWTFVHGKWGNECAAREQENIFDGMFGHNCWKVLVPGERVVLSAKYQVAFNVFLETYIQQASIIQYFFDMILYQASCSLDGKDTLSPDDVDKESIALLLQDNHTDNRPTRNLFVFIIESLESWVLTNPDYAQIACPNMYEFMHRDHTFYADKLRSEVKHGSSGDGQMIITTGLMPIYSGSACQFYGDNVYPSYVHLYEQSAIFNPDPNCWNQDVVTWSYGYKHLYEKDHDVLDNEMSDMYLSQLAAIDSLPVCYTYISIATHMPFDRIKYRTVNIPSDCPSSVANYMNCLHFTDSCFGEIIKKMERLALLDNSVLVISGDHSLSNRPMFESAAAYLQAHWNKSMPTDEAFVPLIVYSSEIDGHIDYTEQAYQFDIYPTILSLIRCTDYGWKGFGVDLLHPTDRNFTEHEAYDLSDQLIRSNYFKTYPVK